MSSVDLNVHWTNCPACPKKISFSLVKLTNTGIKVAFPLGHHYRIHSNKCTAVLSGLTGLFKSFSTAFSTCHNIL